MSKHKENQEKKETEKHLSRLPACAARPPSCGGGGVSATADGQSDNSLVAPLMNYTPRQTKHKHTRRDVSKITRGRRGFTKRITALLTPPPSQPLPHSSTTPALIRHVHPLSNSSSTSGEHYTQQGALPPSLPPSFSSFSPFPIRVCAIWFQTD